MDEYDIIIIGAGIAGCGLAYNLKKIDYQGKILIIDKKEIGANAAYGYRNTFKKIIKEYNIPYEHKYKSISFGTYKKIFSEIHSDFHFFNYKKACKHLLKNSNAQFKKEGAVALGKNIIKTDKTVYKFKYLIDCSGRNFFAKKILKHKLPFKYWIGKTYELKGKLKNIDSYYFFLNSEGFLDEVYPLKNKTLRGLWRYGNEKHFNHFPLSPISEKLTMNFQKKESGIALIPCTPSLPIVQNNIAFLGDSFGNASTSTAEGVSPILETSKILARNIKNNTLKNYEKEWKKKFLSSYLKKLATKSDTKTRLEFLKILKNNPKTFMQLAKNEKMKIPLSLIIKIPKKMLWIFFINYIKLILYYRKY